MTSAARLRRVVAQVAYDALAAASGSDPYVTLSMLQAHLRRDAADEQADQVLRYAHAYVTGEPGKVFRMIVEEAFGQIRR